MPICFSHDLTEVLAAEQIVPAEALKDCLAASSQRIETARGPVEYAIRGEGPLLLVAHGGPGGYDQALLLGELFSHNGFQVVAPSRPGYLGTPVETGRTAEEQGDAMAALLGALGIRRASVIGVSGGGPASYQLAQRHPDIIQALVVVDGISMHYTKGDTINPLEEWFYLSRPGQWLMGFFLKHFPAEVVKGFLKTESTLEKHEIGQRVREILDDPHKFALVDAMFQTMCTRFEARKEGAKNDIAMGSSIDKLPLDRIACPTLLIHGDADDDVPPRDAVYAHGAIAGSQLLWIGKASHIGFWTAPDASKVQRYALDWLKRQVNAA